MALFKYHSMGMLGVKEIHLSTNSTQDGISIKAIKFPYSLILKIKNLDSTKIKTKPTIMKCLSNLAKTISYISVFPSIPAQNKFI